MTFVKTWDETFPSDTQYASLGAKDIRDLTYAIRERLAIDHYFLATEAGDVKIGHHKSATFTDQTADLAAVANSVRLYGKTVDGKIELFLVMADGTVVQITKGGLLNGASFDALASIPAAAGVIPDANLPAMDAGGILGSYKSLRIAYASASTVTVTCAEIVLENSSNEKTTARAVSETLDLSASGANGLDDGSEAASTWYYVWVIAKADGTIDTLLSASSTAPTLPTGYTFKALVGAVRNDGSSNLLKFIQNGNQVQYMEWATMASGAVGTSWNAIDTTAFVPAELSTLCYGTLYGGTYNAAIANDNTVSTFTTHDRNKIINSSHSGAVGDVPWEFEILTANTLWWSTDPGISGIVRIAGFRINKL